MADWRTCRGASMTGVERQWLKSWAEVLAEEFEDLTIVHIGVEYGASLVCSRAGAPEARIVGVDLDCSKFEGGEGIGELITGDSGDVCREFHDPVHFLFIDGDHTLPGVSADMRGWLGKVRPGGVVAFHDYYVAPGIAEAHRGVRDAVDTWYWSDTTWQEVAAPNSIKAFMRKPFLRRGEGFGTIGIGVPYFKPCYEFFRWWSWVLVGGLEMGDQFLNTQNVWGEVPIPLAHNALVREFMQSDRDTLVIVEDDHEGEQDIIRQMRQKRDNWDFDVVCANYPSRHGNTFAIGCALGEPDDYGEYLCKIEPLLAWETGTQRHDCAALGLVFIRRWVLDTILDGRDPADCPWFDWRHRNSQDVQFYGQVKDAGGIAGVDRDARLIHWGKRPYTMEEYYRKRNEYLKQQEEQQEASDG